MDKLELRKLIQETNDEKILEALWEFYDEKNKIEKCNNCIHNSWITTNPGYTVKELQCELTPTPNTISIPSTSGQYTRTKSIYGLPADSSIQQYNNS